MQLSLNWLKDFVSIPSSITVDDLAQRLTRHTVEVEAVIKEGEKFDNFVVGKILEIRKHPQADKLQLVKVDVGDKKLDIVCGASNIAAGQLAPVALAGARLPNGLEIKEAEIRGEKSFGMLCAEDELGLGADHSGIMILEKRARAGESLAGYLKSNDIIFEVDNKSLTHRPDLWSHYGLAREIAAFTGGKFKEYKAKEKIFTLSKDAPELEVEVKEAELCPRYMAIAVAGIKIAASPDWLKTRLIAVGARPINNLVDITNYIMLELGQPLHAFDQKLVDKIIIRRAQKKEIIETLDNKKRELDENVLVIADSSKPIAIAGVMGGANSEITGETTAVILESANFNFASIRKTAQKLDLRTEAAVRFEKSLDPNLCELALARAVELIKKVCPQAEIASQLADVRNFKFNQGPIELDLGWLERILGQPIEEKKIIKILESLGFKLEKKAGKLEVIVPTWRSGRDISLREDLLEEVARLYGFDNLEARMPEIKMSAPEVNRERMLERKIKNFLALNAALAESYNYSFVGERQLQKLKIESGAYLRLVNPIADHQTLLRQTLAPNLIENVKTNQARLEQFGLFEIGSVYLPLEGDLKRNNREDEHLPYQEKHLGLILAGEDERDLFSSLKGITENLLSSLNLPAVFKIAESAPAWADRQARAEIKAVDDNLGFVALLDKNIAKAAGVKKIAVIAEISLKKLGDLLSRQPLKKYQEYAKYPPAVRDLAFVVPAEILYNEIREEIVAFSPLIKKAELFDVYEGEKLGKGKKNLAFHIIYQAEKTLTAEEVDKMQAGLINRLGEKFGAKVRDF